MNIATREALRAIVTGLRNSGAISDSHVIEIVSALEEVEPLVSRYDSRDHCAFRSLCMEIAADHGVETKIKNADAYFE